MKIELGKDSAGAFTGPPVEREIAWTLGGEDYTATVFVRRLSYAAAVGEIQAYRDKSDALAVRIAASICDKDGAPIFTPGDITGEANPERGPLDAALTWALLTAINEVNLPGKSATATSSGTSSSSRESAAAPLPKRKSG